MRLRKKKGVVEKLHGIDFVLDEVGERLRGHWRDLFLLPDHAQQVNLLTEAASARPKQASPLTEEALDSPRQTSPLTEEASAHSRQTSPLTEEASVRPQQSKSLIEEAPARTRQSKPLTEEASARFDQSSGIESKLFVELGVGKGDFISTLSARKPDIKFVGLEAEPTVLYAAARKVQALELSNVRLAVFNVADIDRAFASHEVDRLYINFCDPWPRNKHAKRRLTNIAFLDKYRRILKPGAELRFKTDNLPLFEYSLEQFKFLSLDVEQIIYDLHADNPQDNIETEYERKFSALGAKINRCVVRF